jgi:hypothetical protein
MSDAQCASTADSGQRLAERFPAQRRHVYYLINWAVKQRLIYVETPKVGCTLIKRVMQFAECGFDEDALPEDVHDRRTSPLRSPKDDLAGFLAELESDACLTFSFVRNPFTRFLSAYLDKIVGDPAVLTKRQKKLGIGPGPERPSFDEFVELVSNQTALDMDVHWAPQSFLLGWPRVRYGFLGRFERLTEDLDTLMAARGLRYPIGARRLAISHATGADKKLAAYFSEKTRQRIVDIYGDDFSHFAYPTTLPS